MAHEYSGCPRPGRGDSERVTFLTNNFALETTLIADLYRQRLQVELFYKWIRQHLRIKAFLGPRENAVKTQSGSPSRLSADRDRQEASQAAS